MCVISANIVSLDRIRKSLEKLRPDSVTELLLSNDGDRILEGCVTNYFVVCRKVSSSDLSTSIPLCKQRPWKKQQCQLLNLS